MRDLTLRTSQELRDLGAYIAVAFRNTERSKDAAIEFLRWQEEGVHRVGPIAIEEENWEKQKLAIQLLGELRTERAIPYLLKARETLTWVITNELPLAWLVAMFRTESLHGHKIVRSVWQQRDFLHPYAEALFGRKSNISWWYWSMFGRSYPESVRKSDEGVDLFNSRKYALAIMAFSDAVRSYPYYSGYWRQMGDAKVRMANEGSDFDYDTFRRWWKRTGTPDHELKKRLIWGAITDFTIARELAPFLASELVDIGYGLALAEEFRAAIQCYNQAALLPCGVTTKGYVFFQRAQAHEKINQLEKALHDYKESKQLHEAALREVQSGRVIYTGLPYDLDDMIRQIDARLERLER